MSTSTDQAWQEWGKIDPYFGVVSFPQFKADKIADNIVEFFKTGRDEIEGVIAKVEKLYSGVASGRARLWLRGRSSRSAAGTLFR